jgi:hemoglobin-like flavoprotein
MLTARQKILIQETFALVAPVSLAVADLFYDRLFTLDPSLRPLFTGDMVEQRRNLMQMVTVAVQGLDHLERVVPAVEALGRRHVGYGVITEHHDTVGAAFLWTLDRCLGEAFTPEVSQAWADTYGLLASAMQNASEAAAA